MTKLWRILSVCLGESLFQTEFVILTHPGRFPTVPISSSWKQGTLSLLPGFFSSHSMSQTLRTFLSSLRAPQTGIPSCFCTCQAYGLKCESIIGMFYIFVACVCVPVHMCLCFYACVWICCVWDYVCVYVCICMHMYLCVHVSTLLDPA